MRTFTQFLTEDDDTGRLARATAQGFDVTEPVYHGTRAGVFTTFQPRTRPNEQLGFGIHVTPDRALADRYAHDPDVARRGRQPHVFVGYLRKGRVLDATALVREGSPEFALAMKLAATARRRRPYIGTDEDGTRVVHMQAAINLASPTRAQALIMHAGYDTIQYRARVGQMVRPGEMATTSDALSYVVLNPANLRRVDAAFDPARTHETDLMA